MEECEARTHTLRVLESREAYGRNRGRRIAPSSPVRRLVLILWEPLRNPPPSGGVQGQTIRKELAMTRFSLALAALCAALLIPATALAKGPSQASISGPGLGKAVKISGPEAPGS